MPRGGLVGGLGGTVGHCWAFLNQFHTNLYSFFFVEGNLLENAVKEELRALHQPPARTLLL